MVDKNGKRQGSLPRKLGANEKDQAQYVEVCLFAKNLFQCFDMLDLSAIDQVDGLNRLAMVYEARGEKSRAADYYRKAADFAKSNPGFDKQMVKWFLTEARRIKKE